LQVLLEKGHNPNRFGGATPLSWAARNGHEGVVKLLLEHKSVDMKWQNSKDHQGETPLSLASSNGYGKVVDLLRGAGITQ
jgi:ankyrin repeat protein